MTEPIRISPQEARQKVTAGQALLVCAYDDADKFKANHLEGGPVFSGTPIETARICQKSGDDFLLCLTERGKCRRSGGKIC